MTQKEAYEILGYDPVNSEVSIYKAYADAKTPIEALPDNKYSERREKLAQLEAAYQLLKLQREAPPLSIPARRVSPQNIAPVDPTKSQWVKFVEAFYQKANKLKAYQVVTFFGGIILMLVIVIAITHRGASQPAVEEQPVVEPVDSIAVPNHDSLRKDSLIREHIKEFYSQLNFLANFQRMNTGASDETIRQIKENRQTEFQSLFHADALRRKNCVISISNLNSQTSECRSVDGYFSSLINLSKKYEEVQFTATKISIDLPTSNDYELLASKGLEVNSKVTQVFKAKIHKDNALPDYADETVKNFLIHLNEENGELVAKILFIDVVETRAI
ncbi:MAG: hypothetical protein MI974_20895 [Chitinophagales bacterium]|nr:hypothetical protein [Chitinophagales bacterium]